MTDHIAIAVKVYDLFITPQISLSSSQGQDINLFQNSYMWPKFLNALKRVFKEKNWLDLRYCFNGSFLLSPYVQIKYKRTSKIVNKVVVHTLECSMEHIKRNDYSCSIEEEPFHGSQQELIKNTMEDDSRSCLKNIQKQCFSSEDEKARKPKPPSPIMGIIQSYDDDDKNYKYDVKSSNLKFSIDISNRSMSVQ